MASAYGKGASGAFGGAATGAGIGTLIAPGIGTGIGAAAGGALGGLLGFSQGDDPSVQPYQAPSFADINLQRDNPALYQELMGLKQQEQLAMQAYQSRMSGPTPQERAMQQEQAGQTASGLQARGLLGTSIGQSSTDASAQRVNNNILQRIHDEGAQYLQSANQMQQGYLNSLGNGQNSIMNNLNHQAQSNYDQQLANSQASNQFYSGIFNNGMQGLGQAANTYMMSQMRTPPNTAMPPAAGMSSSPYATAMGGYYGNPSNNIYIPSAAQGPLTQPAPYGYGG